MSTSGERQTPKNRTYTVEDIAAILGIGKSSAYKLANSGVFKTIRISRKSFEDWLGMEEADEASEDNGLSEFSE